MAEEELRQLQLETAAHAHHAHHHAHAHVRSRSPVSAQPLVASAQHAQLAQPPPKKRRPSNVTALEPTVAHVHTSGGGALVGGLTHAHADSEIELLGSARTHTHTRAPRSPPPLHPDSTTAAAASPVSAVVAAAAVRTPRASALSAASAVSAGAVRASGVDEEDIDIMFCDEGKPEAAWT